MQKHYSSARLLAAITLFGMVVALSCTKDHVISDPEPVSGCTRLNGEPREFPCEFVIEKLEFLSGNSDTQVFATLTPQDSLFEIAGAPYSWQKTGTESYAVSYKIMLTFKRIALAPPGQNNKYALILTAGAIDTEDFLEWGADMTGDVALGETGSQSFILDFQLFTWQSISQRMRMLSIINLGTYQKLKGAPYQYAAVRDRAESWIKFRPTNQ